jgi:hypothetical protein
MKLEQLTAAIEAKYSTLNERNHSVTNYDLEEMDVKVKVIIDREIFPHMVSSEPVCGKGSLWKDTIKVMVTPANVTVEKAVSKHFADRKLGQSWGSTPPYLFINGKSA